VEDLITRFAEHGYIAMFLLMLIDTSGLPLPSEIPLLFSGYLVSTGQLEYVPVCLISALGCLAGSLLGYTVSRSVGRAAILRWGKYLHVTPSGLDSAEAWFHRRGEPAVFVCRMIPLARTLISIPAGIAEMNVPRFALFSFAGSVPWAFGLVALGWGLGENWDRVLGSFFIASLTVATVIVAGLSIWLLKRRNGRRAVEREATTATKP
jgi:membrane protein DedA with SNARE-associated domain